MFFRGRCARHDIFRLDDLLNAILDLRYLDAIQIHETMFPPCCGALQRLTAETKHEKMSWFIFFSYARTTERMLPDPIGNVLEILEINCGLGEEKGPSENLLDLVVIWFTMVGWFHLMNIKWENQNSTFQLNGDQPVSASQVASENLQSALQQTWAMEPWAQRVAARQVLTVGFYLHSNRLALWIAVLLWFKYGFCLWRCSPKQRSNSICHGNLQR